MEGKPMNLPQKSETGGNFTMGKMDTRAILIFLGIGLVAGFLAGLIVGGGNILLYLIWGIIGSFVGGFIFTQFNINLGIKNEIVSQIVTSTVGAIVVVLVARLIGG
jgi:uncharacterized membrane protein YeaQ/YmgE (transglycosylase-associated protein family)